MRSALECLAKAAELTRSADLTAGPELRAQFLLMADEWTRLSVVAEWQDRQEFGSPAD